MKYPNVNSWVQFCILSPSVIRHMIKEYKSIKEYIIFIENIHPWIVFSQKENKLIEDYFFYILFHTFSRKSKKNLR